MQPVAKCFHSMFEFFLPRKLRCLNWKKNKSDSIIIVQYRIIGNQIFEPNTGWNLFRSLRKNKIAFGATAPVAKLFFPKTWMQNNIAHQIDQEIKHVTTACRGHPTALSRGRSPLKRSVSAVAVTESQKHESHLVHWFVEVDHYFRGGLMIVNKVKCSAWFWQ